MLKRWFLPGGMGALFCLSVLATHAQAREVPFTLEDRDRLIRIETSLKEFKEAVDKRFEAGQNQMDRRFEAMQNQMDKRFEQLTVFLWILGSLFAALTAATIGFAIWDRRTMIRPFETRVRDLDSSISLGREKIEKVVEALREWSKTDRRLHDILEKKGIL